MKLRRKYIQWLLLVGGNENSRSIPKEMKKCPECNKHTINYIYYGRGNGKERKGHAIVWCSECKMGVHTGDMYIPDWEEMVDLSIVSDKEFEEIISQIPKCKEIKPYFFYRNPNKTWYFH